MAIPKIEYTKEDEYFIEQEVKRLKALKAKHEASEKEAERKRLKDLHYMHCTKCGHKMETEAIVGVEIEVCPFCAGVYLDSGELDKILQEKTRGPFSQAMTYARKLWGES